MSGLKLLSSNIIIDIGLGGFVACRALSQMSNDPTKASNPWNIVSLLIYLFASSTSQGTVYQTFCL